MPHDKRTEPREQLALPITLGGGIGAVTRDISPTGLFFVVEGIRPMSGLVDFEMHLHQSGMKFSSIGEIVRVEHHGGRTGIAVRLMGSRLEVIDQENRIEHA